MVAQHQLDRVRPQIHLIRQIGDTAPPDDYFEELRRISKHQIVWGGNYFKLPPTRGIISWDKIQDMPTLSAWVCGAQMQVVKPLRVQVT